MAAMLRSALAGLALRRSSASLRLPSCLTAIPFSDTTTAGRTDRRRAEESNKKSRGAKDKKARTKPKARSTSSHVHGDIDDLYMMTQLLHDVDSCRHDISRRQGRRPASSVAVPPDHRDEHEHALLRGSSTGPAGSTTRDSLPTTGSSSSCAAKSSSPPGDSSCSGGSWESENSWGSGDSSYSGGWDFSGDFFDFFD